MQTLIITGGNINIDFLEEYLKENKFNRFIAVDKGLEAFNKINIMPDFIIGDFDSVKKEILEQYKNTEIIKLNPEKDFTDTHMALKLAIEIGSDKITIIGAIGTRLDHTLANIHILKEALEQGIYAELINENNRITLIKEEFKLKNTKDYKYISLIPLTEKVNGITLAGFKYLLNNATLEIGQSIGISNEQIKENASIIAKNGILILIQSKD